MLLVQCDSCKKTAFADGAQHQNPDAALECDCCEVGGAPHDHAAHAHAGNAPCRPVTITLVPGQVVLQPVAGG